MLEVGILTVKNVGMLLLYIGTGYLLRRSNKLPKDASKILSTLCTMLFLPAYSINNLSQYFTINRIGDNLALLGCGTAFTFIAIFSGQLLSRIFSKNQFERKSLNYAFAFPNYGYFGYPVIEGVFGPEMLANVMVFTLPFSIACHTYGYLLFSPESKFSWKRLLTTPTIIATFIGIALGLSGIHVPNFFTGILSGIGSCMSPVSMILGGVVLGSFPLKKLLTGGRAYFLTAIRMVGIPALFIGALLFFRVKGIYLMLPALFASLPLGLNMVVFPESYGLDAGDNARMCFVSYLLAIVILPISFSLITMLANP